VSPTPSPIPPEVLERNNNNKSPLKRQINETESTSTDGDSPKKLKSVMFPPSASIAQPKVNESKVGQVSDSSTSTKTFSFSTPKSVIEQSEPKTEVVKQATKKYNFSLPSSLQSSENITICVTNGPGGSLNSVPSASVPSFNFKSSSDSNGKSELNFTTKKTMPDITNNILSKSLRTDKLKGSNSMTVMPDVTATTGFGGFLPAKELKTGSVMDILGLQKSGF